MHVVNTPTDASVGTAHLQQVNESLMIEITFVFTFPYSTECRSMKCC